MGRGRGEGSRAGPGRGPDASSHRRPPRAPRHRRARPGLRSGLAENHQAPPPELWQQYLQEEAKYLDLIQQYNTLTVQYQAATSGKGNAPPNFRGARRLIGLILDQGKKLEALERALGAQGLLPGQSGQ